MLKICDNLRDITLPKLGIRLEDRGIKEASTWKFVGAT